MNIPYDIIYHIYFFMSDYQDIMNFFLINKFFYNNYMRRYNLTYRHKFRILFNDIFSFLSMLPYLKNNDDDLHIYHCLNTMCIEPLYKQSISHDIFFIYHIYKNLIYKESLHRLGINIAPDLTNVILIQGPRHLDRNIKVNFNKNKVKIILLPHSRILELNNSLNFLYLRSIFRRIEYSTLL